MVHGLPWTVNCYICVKESILLLWKSKTHHEVHKAHTGPYLEQLNVSSPFNTLHDYGSVCLYLHLNDQCMKVKGTDKPSGIHIFLWPKGALYFYQEKIFNCRSQRMEPLSLKCSCQYKMSLKLVKGDYSTWKVNS